MTSVSAVRLVPILALAFAATQLAAEDAEASRATSVTVDGGVAAFEVGTNVPAISVKGKSTSLRGRVQVQKTPQGLELGQISAVLPVKSLVTGMGLRDEHMRRYIFTTSDGQVPDVRFEASKATCPAGREAQCSISGTLTIRSVSRPFTMAFKIKDDAPVFRVSGDGVVKLSDFAIERPSQLGVQTANEVRLHLEFSGKAANSEQARLGNR